MSFLEHARDSFTYTLIQAPATSLVQLYDHATGQGESHAKSVHWLDAPQQADMGSADWWGNLAGGTAASMLHFGLLHRLLGTGAAAGLERQTNYGLRAAMPYIGKSVATGAAFSTLFTPVDDNLKGGDFWLAKAGNAGVSGATFGVLTAGAIGLRSTGNRFLMNDVVANSLSGLPAGWVDADLRSYLATGHKASWDERLNTMAQFTAGGAMAGGINMLHEYVAPTTGIRGVRTPEDMKKLADSTIADGHPERWQFDHLQRRLPRTDELMQQEQMPEEWYNRTAVQLRRDIDAGARNMSVEQRKLLVSGTQEMAYGLDAIANRPNNERPIATIYGSARIKPGEFDYELVRYIAGRLVQLGYDVQTGGGPGIMEAGNRGAYEALRPVYDSQGRVVGYDGNSIGVVIKLPWEDGGTNGVGNGYQTLAVLARNFYTRAEMLNQAGPGGVFVVGKGGVGTGAEAFNTITQLQTGKMSEAPVFFVGRKNWGAADNMFKFMARTRMISQPDLQLYKVTDNPQVIFDNLPVKPNANANAASQSEQLRPAL